MFIRLRLYQNHYRLIAVDLSRQKELDAGPKAIQRIEFVGQLKNEDSLNAGGTQSMFILTIFKKMKKATLKFFSRKCNSIIKDGKLSRSKC